MFDPDTYRELYDRILAPNAEKIVLHVNNGTGFVLHDASAVVYAYRSEDLVESGSIKLGDLKLIIDGRTIPNGLRRLEAKDRIQVRGRIYGVQIWDAFSRSIAGEVISVEAIVRG